MQSVRILLGGCPSFEDHYSVVDLKFTDAGTWGAKYGVVMGSNRITVQQPV